MSQANQDYQFRKANLKVEEVAKALGMDAQTVRLMIQEEVVPWGKAWKRPGSQRYSYLISPKLFYDSTGVML